ncbi:MAG: hypothetical protein WB616_08340 [Candidatus Sulfotelmatobacter sp.]|jgi:hypothetical protein
MNSSAVYRGSNRLMSLITPTPEQPSQRSPTPYNLRFRQRHYMRRASAAFSAVWPKLSSDLLALIFCAQEAKPDGFLILPAFSQLLLIVLPGSWSLGNSRDATMRLPQSSQSLIFTVTASIIFLGLVWENAVRSPLLQPRIAALLIVVYLATGYLVAWQQLDQPPGAC